ncbi:MAG TPA: VOC family protein [Rhizomicrobium sp.]|jgi:catechol 2,3-dioxygenase-like lactoylglutathione lyase family enzyme
MLHHVSVGVRDVARAATFYDPVMKALGYKRVADYSPGAIAYGEAKGRPQFWIGLPHDQGAPSSGNGAHVGFSAKSKAAVMKFHEAALKAGGSNNGEPGPRPDYGPSYFGAFIYDLDGNKIEATYWKETAAQAAAAEATKKPAKKKKAATSRNRPPWTAAAKPSKKKKKAKR